MVIWVEKGKSWNEEVYIISSAKHDGICYKAASEKEAARKYEADQGVTVTEIKHFNF